MLYCASVNITFSGWQILMLYFASVNITFFGLQILMIYFVSVNITLSDWQIQMLNFASVDITFSGWQIVMLYYAFGEHHYLGLTNPDVILNRMHRFRIWLFLAVWQQWQKWCWPVLDLIQTILNKQQLISSNINICKNIHLPPIGEGVCWQSYNILFWSTLILTKQNNPIR